MLRAPLLISALLMMALTPAALAQISSGYMDLEEKSRLPGTQLGAFRVLFSKTDAVCPQQTGMFRIDSRGGVTDMHAILPPSRDWRMDATAGPDDFTYRRRVAMESCRIDIDIGEQLQRNGEWVPLVYPFAGGPKAIPNSKSAPLSPGEIEAHNRDFRASAHVGNLRQGVTATVKDLIGFRGARDCFDAIGTYLIDQNGVTLLFPIGLGGELNRFFIERVDIDDNRSALYLSRGSCRVSFTISASVLRNESWVPLPIAPPRSSKPRQDAEKN